ncbi:MAG: carbon-nitrogen hydrolase family protein [Persicimonas sp.]
MKVSLVQICSTRDIDANLARCERFAHIAAADGADWILYPENAPFLGKDAEKAAVAETSDGPIVERFRTIAREAHAWVTLGSFPEASPNEGKTYNTQLLIDPSGNTAATYRKIHLFDVDVEGNRSYRESDSVVGGDEVVLTSVSAPGGDEHRVGLSVCYDLRFPELYRELVARGATVLTVPSAFTLQTGRDHWHPLLRARAIENQSYVLAPNQWGHHFGRRSSYGHSAIYDPWGQRIACAPDKEGVVTAELDFEYLEDVRRRMPSLRHRRL